MIHKITTPLEKNTIKELKAGDRVALNGYIYTARDAAHAKMFDLMEKGKPLPFDIVGQLIYHVGPCPEKPGQVIGSAGPTTSGRMDFYTPKLIQLGLGGIIGKGNINSDVISAIKQNEAVYFGAIGGTGALISKCISKQEIIAFEELGTEAVRKIEVNDFSVIVIVDSCGNNLYESGRKKYNLLSYS